MRNGSWRFCWYKFALVCNLRVKSRFKYQSSSSRTSNSSLDLICRDNEIHINSLRISVRIIIVQAASNQNITCWSNKSTCINIGYLINWFVKRVHCYLAILPFTDIVYSASLKNRITDKFGLTGLNTIPLLKKNYNFSSEQPDFEHMSRSFCKKLKYRVTCLLFLAIGIQIYRFPFYKSRIRMYNVSK